MPRFLVSWWLVAIAVPTDPNHLFSSASPRSGGRRGLLTERRCAPQRLRKRTSGSKKDQDCKNSKDVIPDPRQRIERKQSTQILTRSQYHCDIFSFLRHYFALQRSCFSPTGASICPGGTRALRYRSDHRARTSIAQRMPPWRPLPRR